MTKNTGLQRLLTMDAPPIARLLDWTYQDHDCDRGWITVRFLGKQEFRNPAGHVQGGMLAAMLDDCMGPAILVKSGGALIGTTISLTANYIAPAKPGDLFGEASVVRMGKAVGFVEARLFDPDGTPLVFASSSLRLRQLNSITG